MPIHQYLVHSLAKIDKDDMIILITLYKSTIKKKDELKIHQDD